MHPFIRTPSCSVPSLTMCCATGIALHSRAISILSQICWLLQVTTRWLPEVVGENSPHTLSALDLRGSIASKRGDLETAIRLRTRVVAVCREVYGESTYDTLLAINNLAAMH